MNIRKKIKMYFKRYEKDVTVDELPSVKGFIDYLGIDKTEFESLKKDEQFIEEIYQALTKIRKYLYFTLLEFLSFTDTKQLDALIIKTLKQELVSSFFFDIEELNNE